MRIRFDSISPFGLFLSHAGNGHHVRKSKSQIHAEPGSGPRRAGEGSRIRSMGKVFTEADG